MIDLLYYDIALLQIQCRKVESNSVTCLDYAAGWAGAGGQAPAEDRDEELAACWRGHVPDDCHPSPLARHCSEVQVNKTIHHFLIAFGVLIYFRYTYLTYFKNIKNKNLNLNLSEPSFQGIGAGQKTTPAPP